MPTCLTSNRLWPISTKNAKRTFKITNKSGRGGISLKWKWRKFPKTPIWLQGRRPCSVSSRRRFDSNKYWDCQENLNSYRGEQWQFFLSFLFPIHIWFVVNDSLREKPKFVQKPIPSIPDSSLKTTTHTRKPHTKEKILLIMLVNK